MKTYEEKIYERQWEKRNWKLYDLIMSEGLQEYEPGTVTVLHDDLSVAIVFVKDFMILARDHYNEAEKCTESEYAIYSEHDADGHPLYDTYNMNAIYRLEFVGEETFKNNAFAIAHACNLIKTITDNDANERSNNNE